MPSDLSILDNHPKQHHRRKLGMPNDLSILARHPKQHHQCKLGVPNNLLILDNHPKQHHSRKLGIPNDLSILDYHRKLDIPSDLSILDHHPPQHHHLKMGNPNSFTLPLTQAFQWHPKHPIQTHISFHTYRLRETRCRPWHMHQVQRECNRQLCHLALGHSLCHQPVRQREPCRGSRSLRLNQVQP